ncbi:hypothetical protein B0H17DRAFT_131506 [Mycena rosella]|uniref:Uncharacterized protein n=1 Tax=Mycena rosella TaxID=1033263 RepID=A0AAD7D2G7_MYCRO|nr:hypothetical protein B0H17DRAFT_131506 [Mycena rosella]
MKLDRVLEVCADGLYGHRFYEDAHPRRRIVIVAFISVISVVLFFLNLGYWYTRTSTASISVSGTFLIALSGIASIFAHIANTAATDELEIKTSHFLQWLWLILVTLLTECPLPFFMLKTVARLEVGRTSSNWFPSFRLVGPTHKERNSQRLDWRTSLGVKATVCISLTAICYFFPPHEYHLVSASMPDPSPGLLAVTK